VPEVVEDGATGLLVEAGDHESVARELGRLLAEPEAARRFGEAGRERARGEFSVARMAERTLAVYRESLR
jgi:alpha-maltose-1-phosphate synthase